MGMLWSLSQPPLNAEARRPFSLSSRLITPYNGSQCALYESFHCALRGIFMTDSKDVFYGTLPPFPPILGVKGSQESLHCLEITFTTRGGLLAITCGASQESYILCQNVLYFDYVRFKLNFQYCPLTRHMICQKISRPDFRAKHLHTKCA